MEFVGPAYKVQHMLTPAQAININILAKDGNRPFLMKQAFAEDAELEMVVMTDAISFPSKTAGLPAIEDLLVRRFCADNENIFTFCLSRPRDTDVTRFQCGFLVGMSAKATGQIRVGCGRYDWHFDEDRRIAKLFIGIDVMKILASAELETVIRWLSSLPYPWCSTGDVVRSIPAHRDLSEVEAYLRAMPESSSTS
jgi:hypothetical protein